MERGYIPPSAQAAPGWQSPPSPSDPTPAPDNVLLDLTPRQNIRLTAWLDDRLLSLERDYKKR